MATTQRAEAGGATMNQVTLERLAGAWARHEQVRRLLWGCAAFGGAFAPLGWWQVEAGGIMGAVAAALVWRLRPMARVTAAQVAAHLDATYPELERSASLWLRTASSLTLVERLQLARLEAAWRALPERRAAQPSPRRLAKEATAALVGFVVAVAALVSGLRVATPIVPAASGDRSMPPASVAAPTVRGIELLVTPPSYLQRPARRVLGGDAEVEEGAEVEWRLDVPGDRVVVQLIGSGSSARSEAVLDGNGRYVVRRTISTTWLYQVALTNAAGVEVVLPELHALKAIPDAAPRVSVVVPGAARTIIEPEDARPVEVRALVEDDHGVGAVELIATVAKGTGEAVKFREQVLPLTRETGPDGRVSVARSVDLHALGLEPGDELYFHFRARDNRAPVAQEVRSETRFVVLRGPATVLAEPGAAVAGVNRLPQYFRSQRQLIIDTEKLLADQPGLTAEQFQRRSEDIGVDQKLLRLRYGQFLGEEFEPEAGVSIENKGGAPVAPSRPEEDRLAPLQRMVRLQQNLKHGGHDHASGEGAYEREGRPATVEELREPYVHNHDSTEAATLFDHAVKASLRDVLAAMWEAEGLLRTLRPAEALPAEHRALEMLKELQQADRVYVRRVGFEPTPIKETERRLKGDLDPIPVRATSVVTLPESDPERQAVAASLEVVSRGGLSALSAVDRTALERSLRTAAEREPDRYLAVLTAWAKGTGRWTMDDERVVMRGLWRLLGEASAGPVRAGDEGGRMGDAYQTNLTKPEESAP